MIKAAILGYGTVGSGVAALIDQNSAEIRRSVPEGIEVKYILDLRDFPDSPYRDRMVKDVNVILEDPEIKIICETMGGKGAAYQFSKAALEKGISVCTSNKELVAAFGPELMATAAVHHCCYLFEASVGGGIPLLRTLNTGLSQENITRVAGILNGTTNYILTKMNRDGADFDTVLRRAQELGYAERNPEADVEGHDTARKIAIITSLISGRTARYEDVPCEGITKIDSTDFALAAALHAEVKLLGLCEKEGDGRYAVITAPFLVPETSLLAPVQDVFNGVLIHGTMVDDVVLIGRGAGRDATASAVVSDVIDAARHPGETVPCPWKGGEPMPLVPLAEQKRRFLVRVPAAEAGLAEQLFGAVRPVEAERGAARPTDPENGAGQAPQPAEYAFVTPLLSEGEFAEKAGRFSSVRRIRLLDSDMI